MYARPAAALFRTTRNIFLLSLISLWPGLVLAQTSQTGKATTSVNIRAETNTSSRIVATLSAGQTVEILEEAGGYYRVRTANGSEGYLRTRFIERDPPPAVAQAEPVTPPPSVVEPVPSTPAPARATELDPIEVTGSRILREDYTNTSKTTAISREDIDARADITLETFLNTLPEVNPAGTITSNNPGNGGQASIDLRGLGSNRNLVLIDGRRPMVSQPNQTVDLNTIPAALIERIEVITGGAGAVYGADAVAGVVNIITKKNYQGADLRISWRDTQPLHDAMERQFSTLLGTNFLNDKANFTLGFDYGERESVIKGQRDFAAVATSTTSFLPEGLYFPSGNAPTQGSVDTVFGTYGVGAGLVPAASTLIGFNLDGTLFSRGIFNSPIDAQNFRYPIDLSVNTNLFPDLYSYNFDSVNLLVLPLERYSGTGKLSYRFDNEVEFFTHTTWTNYTSATALAPSPIATGQVRAPGENSATQASSPLVSPGSTITALLIIPSTNPFIPADFATLLASRAGDNANLVGSAATEPFLMRQRTLSAGLRQSVNDNTVYQTLVGFGGPIDFGEMPWRWEVSGSAGRTTIEETQLGNINAQVMQELLEAADGGVSRCAGGFNVFGRQPISQQCLDLLQVVTNTTTTFDQEIGQAFVAGDVAQLPYGPLSVVFGIENRKFDFEFVPGAVSGPISGFNTQSPAAGSNNFRDIFYEVKAAILRDLPFAESLDIGFGYRNSRSQFQDDVAGLTSQTDTSSAYKLDLTYQPFEKLTARSAFQRSVRAPNFGELFSGGSSAPQYFDPCSVTSAARNGSDAVLLRQLCIDTGVSAGAVDTYVQSPGSQISIETAGNTDLKPEEADTFTFGIVAESPWGGVFGDLQASVDYYRIRLTSPILVPEANLIVASCYNYFGTNPTYSAADPNCQSVVRFGGDILFLAFPGDPDGVFPGINGGRVDVSGIDFQVDWGLPLGEVGLPALGALKFNLRSNYVLEYAQQDPGLPEVDYAGTVSYFGQNLGASAPEWKINLGTRWTLADLHVDVLGRYIDGMENRASKQFPDEQSFSGTGSVTYWDLGVGTTPTSNISLRVGFINVFDKQPPVYAPNVQSGTDPSLFDIYGRRAFAQAEIKF